jgi:hypothetical protein
VNAERWLRVVLFKLLGVLILPVPEGEGELRPAKVKLTAGGDDMLLLEECSIVDNKFVIEMLK